MRRDQSSKGGQAAQKVQWIENSLAQKKNRQKECYPLKRDTARDVKPSNSEQLQFSLTTVGYWLWAN